MWEREIWRAHKNYSEIPGITYSFQNQNLVNFEQNFYYRNDLPFMAFCDFESSTGVNGHLDKEGDKIHPVS